MFPWETYVTKFWQSLGSKTEKADFSFDGRVFKNSKENTIYNKLTFYNQIKELCKKAPHQISALWRISPYLDSSKKSLIFKSSTEPQFSYYPLIWMFCSRTSNNMINKMHEHSPRVILDDEVSSFAEGWATWNLHNIPTATSQFSSFARHSFFIIFSFLDVRITHISSLLQKIILAIWRNLYSNCKATVFKIFMYKRLFVKIIVHISSWAKENHLISKVLHENQIEFQFI